MWRFHRSIHSDFLLLSHNSWGRLGTARPAVLLSDSPGGGGGGGCSNRWGIFITAPLLTSPIYVPAGPWGLGILIAVGLSSQCPASLRLLCFTEMLCRPLLICYEMSAQPWPI